MSFKCQIFQTKLTFNHNVFTRKSCDVRLIIILCVISAIMPMMIKCAKLENPQIRLLINEDDLLQEKRNLYETGGREAAAFAADKTKQDHSGEHFNLYRSELKRLSYETIHRILRDENEPSYRREETELRYYQKRSPSYEENHQLIKRSTTGQPIELDLSNRNLTQFTFTPQQQQRFSSSSVAILNLANNYLSQLNISHFDHNNSLMELNLQNNSFTSIPLDRNTTLRTLNLNHNLIRTAQFDANIYLRNLFLSANLIENLSSIPLSLLKNLETLDLSHNSLANSESSFFMQRMHNLKHLNLASNRLGSIYRETFYNLLSLNTLLLSHNHITDIDYETFLALPNLQFLDLSFNSLQGKSIRALQGITGLVALNIAFNPDIGPFMQEFVASWSLKELDASGIGLCQIPAALAQSVRSLKLTHNWLKIINCGDLDSYPLLQYLDLSFSHIEQVEDDALGRLEILEILMLDHNKLRKIPFSLSVSLEHLFLQNNEIMEIPQQAFQGLNNLKTLDLSHNKLLYLPDIMLPKLQTLNLQSSEITGISQGIIHTLPKLNDLMLEDNPIKCTDLLGIAEWASICRLRPEKEADLDHTNDEREEENFNSKIQNLKTKFKHLHNYYEQFGLNSSSVNDTTLNSFEEPLCTKDNSNSLPAIQKNAKAEKENDELFTANVVLSKSLKEINLNLNAEASGMSLTATKTNANKSNTITKESKKLKEEKAVKTISIESPTQTFPASMKSSILNENQQTLPTNPKSFYTNATTTTISSASKFIQMQGQRETEIAVQPITTNKTKTFDHLTANAATTNQQHEIASIGNTRTKSSSSNMTEIVEAVSKRTKAAVQKQIEDMQHKTTFRKTFQTTKSKKWLKQEPPLPLKSGGGTESTQNMPVLLKHSQSGIINAEQFIKSTTFATLHTHSEQPAATTANPPSADNTSATATATAAAFVTTTTAEAFVKKNKIHEEKEFKDKLVDVVGFERAISSLEINRQKKKQQQQQHEIKAKIATIIEIKSSATKAPKTKHTITIQETAKPTTSTIMPTTSKPITTATQMALQISQELTATLDKSNKKLNEFIPQNFKEILTTNLPFSEKAVPALTEYATEVSHEQAPTTKIAATKLKTFKTIEQLKSTAVDMKPTSKEATTTTNTKLVKNKDLAANYNDNDNKRQITKTLNKTSTILTIQTTRKTPITTSISTRSNGTSGNVKNNKIAKIFETTTSSLATNNNNDASDQPQPHFLQNMMLHYQRNFSQKDVNVKCIKTNFNECNSATTTTQRPDELGKLPTIEATLEQTTATKTSTEISKANEVSTATTIATSVVIKKHEPLQLLVKDRHLIGTPLLMHKGENLMVTTDELILPTNNHKNEQENNDNNSKNTTNSGSDSGGGCGNINNKEHHDLETHTMANNSKYEPHLESSQTTALPSATLLETTRNNLLETDYKIHNSFKQSLTENFKQQQDPNAKQNDSEKIKKSSYESKNKKPSLIMKKMTIITKQHDETQHKQPLKPLENEVHNKQFDSSHYQELKPLGVDQAKEASQNLKQHKHSTVNTPINQDNTQPANLIKQPNTFQHEHELLLQQILHDQQTETHDKLSKSEQWSDLRRLENKENHSGLILLVSSGLFLVLLLGLMHVYRCDMPWRRQAPSHHLRPHQRQQHSMEDDAHSFLSYSEGMQKWHHSTRLEAPYNSPLHNLHVRELQKTSATEKPATVKSTIINFKQPLLGYCNALDNTRSLSQSSTTTTSTTASASSSNILDDESFYIEMTPDSEQFSRTIQSELLPMELLNGTQTQSLEYPDTPGESQTSLEDECIAHFQQHRRHVPHRNALTSSACSSTSSAVVSPTTCRNSKASKSRKFGFW